MLQLLVPNVDNEKIFEKIAERKTYKNSHCKECEDDRSICSICCHGKRGKMLHLKKRVFESFNSAVKTYGGRRKENHAGSV